MIYDVYFWKKPRERRLYMSSERLDPDVLQNLRSQGYRIFCGRVPLPDDPEEPLFDQELQVQTSELVAAEIWPGRPWPAAEKTENRRRRVEDVQLEDRIVVRDRCDTETHGVIESIATDEFVARWERGSRGYFKRPHLADLMQNGDVVIYPAMELP